MFDCFKKKKKIHVLEEIFEPRPKPIVIPKYTPKSILKNKKRNNTKKSDIKENKSLIEDRIKKREQFTEIFLSEVIECGGCNEVFTLRSGELKINCASCNRFFHCHIAGACIGPDCSTIMDGEKHSLKYCMSCVNPYLKINIMDNGQCLCKKCEESSDIPNHYKDV